MECFHGLKVFQTDYDAVKITFWHFSMSLF